MILPGEYLWVVGGESAAFAARTAGLQLRDTVAMLLPGPLVVTAFLFRHSLDGAVVETVCRHGQGALNIDACRIMGHVGVPASRRAYRRFDDKGDKPRLEAAPDPHPGGRWPSNLLLVHGPGCQPMGSVKIRGSHDTTGVWGQAGPGIVYGQWADRDAIRKGFTASDGTETVAAWDCQPDCSVKLLDVLSGHLKTNPGSITPNMASMGYHGGSGSCRSVLADSGGASRFYPQFPNLPAALDWLTQLIRTPGDAHES